VLFLNHVQTVETINMKVNVNYKMVADNAFDEIQYQSHIMLSKVSKETGIFTQEVAGAINAKVWINERGAFEATIRDDGSLDIFVNIKNRKFELGDEFSGYSGYTIAECLQIVLSNKEFKKLLGLDIELNVESDFLVNLVRGFEDHKFAVLNFLLESVQHQQLFLDVDDDKSDSLPQISAACAKLPEIEQQNEIDCQQVLEFLGCEKIPGLMQQHTKASSPPECKATYFAAKEDTALLPSQDNKCHCCSIM